MGEDACDECKHIKDTIQRTSNSSEPNAFSVHADINVFKTKDKNKKQRNKKDKKKIVNYINKLACALRNTLGGFILIHLSGQDDGDLSLGHFDEVIGSSLRELQQDGDLFVNTFRRTWEEHEVGTGSVNLIHLEVRKSDVICTSSFNTKVCTDHENTDATVLDVLSLLCSDTGSPDNSSAPALRGIDRDTQKLHENRSIQLKRVVEENLAKLRRPKDYLASFVDYIWDDLKFKHSLTSMSKVEGGGSFYLGVQELKDTKITKIVCEGFKFEFPIDDLKRKLLEKIEKEVSVLTRNGTFIKEDIESLNLICVGEHTAEDSSKSIIEIAVRYFNGIVFHEKEGPRAYHIQNSKVCRIEFQEWYNKMKLLTDCEKK